ncbi:hypothetical protein I3843_14G033800 [Carya illinoinensis]|nr:hypothetical protein I3843_14G033800 [Carya illinoinensis]
MVLHIYDDYIMIITVLSRHQQVSSLEVILSLVLADSIYFPRRCVIG